MKKAVKISVFCLMALGSASTLAETGELGTSDDEGAPSRERQPTELVESFTANLLVPGEVKLGSELSFGLSARWNIGTDLIAGLIGVPTLQLKYLAFVRDSHKLSLGLGVAYFDKSTILWGSVDEHFEHLTARVLKPSFSYSRDLSHRLSIHTHWSSNIGKVEARLSETGRKRLWESKYPDREFGAEEASDDSDESVNRAAIRSDSVAQRTMQVSSITGMASELFQFTGEFRRQNGNKVLISNRMERTHLEKLQANFFRLTAAQQWVWPSFQFRLGIGLQYVTIHGTDLDGEQIDESGFLPASDIDFYWRF